MFYTSLKRELLGRRKQTAIVAVGLALAVTLVMLIGGVAAGVRTAQAEVLTSIYGIGTDITVSGTPTAPGEGGEGGRGERFDFDSGTENADGGTSVATSRLTPERGAPTIAADTLSRAASVAGVSAAAGALALSNINFDGQLPAAGETRTAPGAGQEPPAGGGGGSFNVDSTSVLGIDPSAVALGPLSGMTLATGRTLAAGDATASVAVLDSAYATTAELAVGDTVNLGGSDLEIIGTVDGSAGTAAADVFIPLQTAQQLSGQTDLISTVYVQADSAENIAAVTAALEEELPETTVSTQEDLAANVSGSLSSASDLVGSLGTWLSIIALSAAALLAILFTVSGVTRRTREFGTLKALGWSNRRVVGQVAGESVVQALIGGVIGVALGLIGMVVVNLIAPTIGGTSAASTAETGMPGAGGPGGFGGAPGAAGGGSTAEVALHLPFDPWLIAAAVGLAVASGLLAGAVGGWRAARLSPSEALRAVV